MRYVLMAMFVALALTGFACQKLEIREERYANGQLKERGTWKLDFGSYLKQGKWTSWHENGQKHIEAEYRSDKLQGKLTAWYRNGQMEAQVEYRNGKKHGKFAAWYENGQKKMEGEYRDGKEHGKPTFWSENGQIEDQGAEIE